MHYPDQSPPWQPPRKSASPVWIVAAVIVVLALVGAGLLALVVGLWFLSGRSVPANLLPPAGSLPRYVRATPP